MASDDVKKDKSALGFWKFAIISSLGLALARSYFGFHPFSPGSWVTMFPFGIAAWIAYRVSRIQPWWPFRDEARAIPIVPPENFHLKKHNVRAAVRGPAEKPILSKRPIKPFHKMTPKILPVISSLPVSSVGLRSKTIRAKTVRQKTVRTKRRPEFSTDRI